MMYLFFVLSNRQPQCSTLSDTPFPASTLFLSAFASALSLVPDLRPALRAVRKHRRGHDVSGARRFCRPLLLNGPDLMDFSLSPKLVELQQRTRAFIADEAIPLENDPRQSAHGPSEALRAELVARARRAGLLTPHASVELGGLEIGRAHV